MNHAHEKISPDDPRLTAYALGELKGAEHATVAAAVAADPVLAAEVHHLRAFAAQLRAELAAEPAPAVAPAPLPDSAPAARAAIVHPQEWRKPDTALAREASNKILRFPALYWLATAAAACFALAVWVKNPSAPAAPEKVAASRPQPAPATTQTQVANGTLPAPPAARAESQIASAASAPQSATPAIDQPRYQPGVTVAADGTAAPKDSVPAQPARASTSETATTVTQLTVASAAATAVSPPTATPAPAYDGGQAVNGGADRLDNRTTTGGGGTSLADANAAGSASGFGLLPRGLDSGAGSSPQGAGAPLAGLFVPGAGAGGFGGGGGAADVAAALVAQLAQARPLAEVAPADVRAARAAVVAADVPPRP